MPLRVWLNRAVPAQTQALHTSTGFVLVHKSATPKFPPQPLMSPVVYLGRLATNDVVLHSDNVSRRHAKLIVTDLGVTAHDLDSHNGLFLNGKKVRSAPVKLGDLLYVGDVCVELQSASAATLGDSAIIRDDTRIAHADISDEEDPNARSLAALSRIALVVSGSDDDGNGWATEVVQLCRELVDATVAAFIEQDADGDLDAPIVLAPQDGDRRGAAAVNFEIVQRVVQSGEASFGRPGSDGESQGTMAAPLRMPDGSIAGVLYLARDDASLSFSDVEFETLQVIAALVAWRVHRGAASDAEGSPLVDDVVLVEPTIDSTAQSRLAELEDQLAAADAREQDAKKETAKLLEQAEAKLAAQIETQEAQLAAQLSTLTSAHDQETEAAANELTKERERAASMQAALDVARQEIDTTRASLDTLRDDRDALRDDRDGLRQQLETLQQEMAQTVPPAVDEALRQALRVSVLPTIVEHVEAVAAGEAKETSAVPRSVTVCYLALADFDAWCERAAPDDVKAHLDAFVSAVASRTQANGGRIDQVVGHGHIVVFGADPASAQAAVRCALEAAAIVDAEDHKNAPSVVAGVHTGVAVAGFFGDADALSYVEAGLPVVIARAAVDFAPKSNNGATKGVLISDAVRTLIQGVAGLRMTRLDPSWIRGVNAPVQLALVDIDGGGE